MGMLNTCIAKERTKNDTVVSNYNFMMYTDASFSAEDGKCAFECAIFFQCAIIYA